MDWLAHLLTDVSSVPHIILVYLDFAGISYETPITDSSVAS